MPKHHHQPPGRTKVTTAEFRQRLEEIKAKNATARGKTVNTNLPFEPITPSNKPKPRHSTSSYTRSRRTGVGAAKARLLGLMTEDGRLKRAEVGYQLDDPVFTDPKVTEFGRAVGDKRICYYCHHWDHPGACVISRREDGNGLCTVRIREWTETCGAWRQLRKDEAKTRGYDEA